MRPQSHLRLYQVLGLALVLTILQSGAIASEHPDAGQEGVTPETALQSLREGNDRYVNWVPIHPRVSQSRRDQTASGQHPFAAILGCADSRVPPEILFDQGLGDLFDVRVAGNVAGPHEIGSLEYAVEHLDVPLIVVLGHTRCGAVSAALDGGEAPGSIPSLLEEIRPAVDQAHAAHPAGERDLLLTCAVEMNLWHSVEAMITQSAIIREKLSSGEIRVVGALYNIGTGHVELLGSHPQQGEFMGLALTAKEK
jgi:carbonic anhydrase